MNIIVCMYVNENWSHLLFLLYLSVELDELNALHKIRCSSQFPILSL